MTKTKSMIIWDDILKFADVDEDDLKSIGRDNWGGTYFIVYLSNGLTRDYVPGRPDEFAELIEWIEEKAPLRLVHKDEI